MTDYIKADVGVMTLVELDRNGHPVERTFKTWAHRKRTPDEIEARRRCAFALREKRIARIAKTRKLGLSGGSTA